VTSTLHPDERTSDAPELVFGFGFPTVESGVGMDVIIIPFVKSFIR
jgi:hypothetical protein